jgi:hypothetical protein
MSKENPWAIDPPDLTNSPMSAEAFMDKLNSCGDFGVAGNEEAIQRMRRRIVEDKAKERFAKTFQD